MHSIFTHSQLYLYHLIEEIHSSVIIFLFFGIIDRLTHLKDKVTPL